MSETNDQRIYDRCLIRVGELDEHKRYQRIFYGIGERDMWVEVREVGSWKELANECGARVVES